MIRGKYLLTLLTSGSLLWAMACGGDDDDPEAESDPSDEESGLTPMEEFFGPTWTEEDETEWLAHLHEVQVLVADCMLGLGFEYVVPEAQDVSESGPAPEGEGDGEPVDDVADFVSTNGYGVSTIEPEAGEVEGDANRRGPNAGVVAAMTEAERAAYDQALRGDWVEYDTLVDDENVSDEELVYGVPPEAGCYGAAVAEVFGGQAEPPGDAVAQQFPALAEAGEAMEGRIETDPRVAEALQAWSDCVADAGHPDLASPDDAIASIEERFATVADDPAALEELQQDEVSLAVADRDCQEEVELDQVRFDVRVDLEQEFIDENREELEQARDALIAANDG